MLPSGPFVDRLFLSDQSFKVMFSHLFSSLWWHIYVHSKHEQHILTKKKNGTNHETEQQGKQKLELKQNNTILCLIKKVITFYISVSFPRISSCLSPHIVASQHRRCLENNLALSHRGSWSVLFRSFEMTRKRFPFHHRWFLRSFCGGLEVYIMQSINLG